MTQLDGKSKDLINENIEKLKEIFPEVFSEGKIDFSKLEEELGFFKEKSDERYNFTWNGKSEAKKIALTPSTGTLRPCKEESKDWDTTQNLYIEGDNLEVLKLTTTFLKSLFLFKLSSISLAQLAQSKLFILYLYFFICFSLLMINMF
jgi:hypothetical protein